MTSRWRVGYPEWEGAKDPVRTLSGENAPCYCKVSDTARRPRLPQGGHTWTSTDAVTPVGHMSMTGGYSALCHTHAHLPTTARFSSVVRGGRWGPGCLRLPGAPALVSASRKGVGEGSTREGRCLDLLCPQFPKRDGCRVPFAVTRLPCSVCDPLLPTNQPASGASLRPQRPCPRQAPSRSR